MPRIARVFSELGYCKAQYRLVCTLISCIEIHLAPKVMLYLCRTAFGAELWCCKLGLACLSDPLCPLGICPQKLSSHNVQFGTALGGELVNWPAGVIRAVFCLVVFFSLADQCSTCNTQFK